MLSVVRLGGYDKMEVLLHKYKGDLKTVSISAGYFRLNQVR